MSIFSDILEKLGIRKPAPAVAPAKPKESTDSPQPGPMGSGPGGSFNRPQVFSDKVSAMPMVDVVSKLDGLAAKNPEKLNWKVSIVDMLKLLGLDASSASIQELAVELGCPASEMSDSYKRNVWLHQALMNKIAENGGNIPQNLLH